MTSLARAKARTLFAAAVVTVLASAGSVTLSASPAAAAVSVSGLERIAVSSSESSSAIKEATAVCPAGKQVTGGGAAVIDRNAGLFAKTVTLTQVEPFWMASTGRWAYRGRAAETYSGTLGSWWLSVFAVCANPIPGYSIQPAATSLSSSAVQNVAAVCPTGTRALGSGARVNFAIGASGLGIGLQIARPSGLGDITRAQAQEAAPYSESWQLYAFAICATPPAGYEIRTASSSEMQSETFKDANADCEGKKMLGGGGALGTDAPPQATLNTIWPQGAGPSVLVVGATENTPTPDPWGIIVAYAACAT